MARKRVIDPEFWLDEEIAGISAYARLLYIGLWGICDDNHATFPDRPDWIKAQVFPYNAGVDIEKMLRELEVIKKIIKFSVGGKDFWWLKNFLKHQRIDRPSAEKYPPFSNSNRTFMEPSSSTRPELNRSKEKLSKDNSISSEALLFNQTLFKELSDSKIEISPDPKDRLRYPRLLRGKDPDVKNWLSAAKWGEQFNFRPKGKEDYVFPWRGKLTLPKLYYDIYPKWLEKVNEKGGFKRLTDMKKGMTIGTAK